MNNELNYRQLLIDIRTEHNLSQEELADMLEVSRQTVARWEAGKNNPAANQIARLCKIFNLNLVGFTAETPETENTSATSAELPTETLERTSVPFKKYLIPILLIGALIALSVIGLIITIVYAIKDSQFDTVVTTLIIALPQNTPMVVLAIMLGCFIAVLATILLYLIRRKDK